MGGVRAPVETDGEAGEAEEEEEEAEEEENEGLALVGGKGKAAL